MGNAIRIFLLGLGVAGMVAYLQRRTALRPPMQDDAGNPAC